MPRLARPIPTPIGSCKIYYLFEIKAGRFRKRYLSCNRFARKQLVRVRFFGKFYSPFITMGFVTDVCEFQALLDACSSTREWELLIESILIPEEWIPMAHARLSELTGGGIT